MTDDYILEKVIAKAVKNGWKSPYASMFTSFPDIAEEFIDSEEYLKFIYSHEFAKALWGSEGIVIDTPTQKIYGSNVPAWEWNLQQMVIAENPIQYMAEFI